MSGIAPKARELKVSYLVEQYPAFISQQTSVVFDYC
jgi:hypothetical protein